MVRQEVCVCVFMEGVGVRQQECVVMQGLSFGGLSWGHVLWLSNCTAEYYKSRLSSPHMSFFSLCFQEAECYSFASFRVACSERLACVCHFLGNLCHKCLV